MQRRFNETSALAQWGLELSNLHLVDHRRGDLLSAAPRYRQALAFFLNELAARSGRPFAEWALRFARDRLPFDRREVLDAWVIEGLSPGQQMLGQDRVERADFCVACLYSRASMRRSWSRSRGRFERGRCRPEGDS